ncbi:hypothetical protein B0H14DRAFT_2629107 [Mycena olivaceomarginata]|nr:hypothetical protein B0H14DRAFT_2629107 [Mycena olivaceomarginata]
MYQDVASHLDTSFCLLDYFLQRLSSSARIVSHNPQASFSELRCSPVYAFKMGFHEFSYYWPIIWDPGYQWRGCRGKRLVPMQSQHRDLFRGFKLQLCEMQLLRHFILVRRVLRLFIARFKRARRNNLNSTLGPGDGFCDTDATEEVTQALPSASSASTPATTSKGNSSSTLRLGSTNPPARQHPLLRMGPLCQADFRPPPKGRVKFWLKIVDSTDERHSRKKSLPTGTIVGISITISCPRLTRRIVAVVIPAASLMPIPTQSSLDTRGVSKVRRQILQNELRVTQDKMTEIHRLHDALPREPAPGVIHHSLGSRPDLLGSYVAAAGKKRGVGGAYSRVGSKHGISMGAWPLGGALRPDTPKKNVDNHGT